MRFRPDERLKYIEILKKSPQQVFEKEQQVKEVLFFKININIKLYKHFITLLLILQ